MVKAETTFTGNRWARRHLQRHRAQHPKKCREKSYPKQQYKIAGNIIQINPGRWGYGHSQIIAQPIITYALVAPFGRKDIYGRSTISHRRRPERQAVKRSHYGKHQQRPGGYVPGKTYKEKEKTYHQNSFAVKCVYNETAERTYN